MDRIYLDHNATTPAAAEVIEAVSRGLAEEIGNPSSLHYFGQRAKRRLEEAREEVAGLIGAEAKEIIFLSGGTEANNLAIKGVAEANAKQGRHLVTSAVEHHAVLHSFAALEKRGFEVTRLPVDEYGRASVEALEPVLRPGTVLVSVMLANNEVGTLQPVAEMAALCRERGVLFHTDAVQAVGKVPVDVEKLGVDLLSLSGHKFYGPRGVGALYVRKGVPYLPQMHGGHQERNRRAGTEDLPGIVGMGVAARLARQHLPEWAAHTQRLRELLQTGIEERMVDVKIFGHPQYRLPNTLCAAFGGTEGESLLMNLDLKGVAVSTGSACSSGAIEPSHVLQAMRVPAEYLRAALRFSLGKDNTEEQIARVLELLGDIIPRVRSLAPGHREASGVRPQAPGK
ncbi:MAG: cysteine desulfurase NifS [Deltaproteobacteria bacterium RBG_13_61_14]|nr:MAG: cysteine desulfurase NifS [Deltaproteobacteria bacterium RBG_13_61_14]